MKETRRLIMCVHVLLLIVLLAGAALAQAGPLVLERNGRVLSLVPYAPNILRITMSVDKSAAAADPGYGITATPSSEGWTHERDPQGGDLFRSARIVVRVASADLPDDMLPKPMPLDDLNHELREIYFGGSGAHGPYNDSLVVTTAEGKTLLHMRNWTMTPQPAASNTDAKTYGVVATFDSPDDEHYYGLGQQQQGLDGSS